MDDGRLFSRVLKMVGLLEGGLIEAIRYFGVSMIRGKLVATFLSHGRLFQPAFNK
ncbi:MAG: hypothetical protein GY820_40410 [Gammaproteobacteria bacterium]|nr:hypothetical protein [Gammaproteobacteria bacterium]